MRKLNLYARVKSLGRLLPSSRKQLVKDILFFWKFEKKRSRSVIEKNRRIKKYIEIEIASTSYLNETMRCCYSGAKV